MRYQISHLLKGEAREYHENLSNTIAKAYKLTPVSARIDSHLTFKAPFDATGSDVDEVERIITEFVRTHSKAPYSLGGFGKFEDRVVYMDVEAPEETMDLVSDFQNELKRLMWLEFRPYETPPELHATLCYPRTAAQSADLYERLTARGGKTIESSIDNIAILKRGERRWEVYKEFALGGGDGLDEAVRV